MILDKLKCFNANTVNLCPFSIRAFFTWAFDEGLVNANYVQGVRSAKRSKDNKAHRKDILTDTEMVMLLNVPDLETFEGIRDSAIIHLMAFTAVRSVEINRANIENLRTEQGHLVLYVHGKGHLEADEKVVIANAAAQEAHHRWLAVRPNRKSHALFQSFSNRTSGERLSLRAIRFIIKQYFALIGVHGENKTTHSIRHTAITKAIQNGATPMQAKEMARHQSVDTTMIYYHSVTRLENPAEGLTMFQENTKLGHRAFA